MGSMEGSFLWMALALSVGGSLHCIGMCGGFAVLANTGSSRVGITPRFMAYAFGKTLSYAILGASIGWLGTEVGAWKRGGAVLAWVAGLAMIAVAGHLLGWPGFSRLNTPAAARGFVSRFAALLKKDSIAARFGMGVMNGWLPCGLVYAAVAMAMTAGSVPRAVLFMTVFGLGTVPSLWVAAQLTAVLPVTWRVRMSRLSGWLVVLFGVYTILRGTGVMAMITGGHM